MSFDFTGQVAIVTGAGGGLGRAHALAFAARGAKVVINDLGGARDGDGASLSAAEQVVKEITDRGGEAIANGGNVTSEDDMQALVSQTLSAFGRLDILVNNAGILRDKTFSKMSLDDFRKVLEVHLMGSVIATRAVLPTMQKQEYGRIVMTTSSSGLYGNFGQSNYGAAKLALVGLANTLKLEFSKFNIRVNALAPVAATRMTDDIMPPQMLDFLTPESVSPAVLYLCGAAAPNGEIITAGAGTFARAKIMESKGLYLGPDATPEQIAAQWDVLADLKTAESFDQGSNQSQKFVVNAFENKP
ncbi:SDR family NAD(P)-dependent oxidoreductase [Paremcibacter congregatus]|uniref:SDR family NAD(P)-dependent oxidoreductase n=1 Tax=Paremcibacter congregatus TaxID=2043170 RepID=UPI0030EDA937